MQDTNIYSIIQNIFAEVRGNDTQLQANCPRCSDELGEPDGKFNLEINIEKHVFKCWRCDQFGGSLGKLIKEYGTKQDYVLYRSYASFFDEYNYDFDNDDYEVEEKVVSLPIEMIKFADMDAMNADHFEAYNYMINERKISREILIDYNIGFCVTGKYFKRIIIPSYDIKGRVNYFVARNYDTNDKKKKPYDNPKSDKNSIIFNEMKLSYDSTIYICEGVFEMLSFPVNTVPLLGKTIGTALFTRLKEIKPEVVILLDPDAYKNTISLYHQLTNVYVGCEERVKIVKLPNNDDLDELRRMYGHDEVIKCLRTARGLIVDDYFISELKVPYVKPKGRNSYSKYFEWKENR